MPSRTVKSTVPIILSLLYLRREEITPAKKHDKPNLISPHIFPKTANMHLIEGVGRLVKWSLTGRKKAFIFRVEFSLIHGLMNIDTVKTEDENKGLAYCVCLNIHGTDTSSLYSQFNQLLSQYSCMGVTKSRHQATSRLRCSRTQVDPSTSPTN